MAADPKDWCGRANEAASEILQFRNRFAQHEAEMTQAKCFLAQERQAHEYTKQALAKLQETHAQLLQQHEAICQQNNKAHHDLAGAQLALKEITERAGKQIAELTQRLAEVKNTPEEKLRRIAQLRESIVRCEQAAAIGHDNARELADLEASMKTLPS